MRVIYITLTMLTFCQATFSQSTVVRGLSYDFDTLALEWKIKWKEVTTTNFDSTLIVKDIYSYDNGQYTLTQTSRFYPRKPTPFSLFPYDSTVLSNPGDTLTYYTTIFRYDSQNRLSRESLYVSDTGHASGRSLRFVADYRYFENGFSKVTSIAPFAVTKDSTFYTLNEQGQEVLKHTFYRNTVTQTWSLYSITTKTYQGKSLLSEKESLVGSTLSFITERYYRYNEQNQVTFATFLSGFGEERKDTVAIYHYVYDPLGRLATWYNSDRSNKRENRVDYIYEEVLAIENPLLEEKIKVYPNPSGDFITVNLEAFRSPNTLEIWNAEGNRVLELSSLFSEKLYTIDLNNWVKGIYVLKIFSECGVSTRKIVKR